MKIAVIGAGFGGMSVAAYLAKSGHEVHVFERNPRPGGRAYNIKEKGYSFDLGPNWYLMPDAFEEFFADFGKKTEDYYRLMKISPSYRAFFSDVESRDFHTAPDAYKDFDLVSKGAGSQLERFLEHTRHEYRQIRHDMSLFDGLHKRQLARPSAFEMLANPHYVSSYHQRVVRAVGNEKLQKILEMMVPLLGGSPQMIPGLYGMLSWVDFGLGIWHPMGGFSAVSDAFEKIAKEQGVKFHYNREVEKINVEGRSATSLTIDGKIKTFHSIVANADYQFVETQLLEESYRSYGRKHWQNKTFSSSAVLATIGVAKKLNLEHHNLFFDAPWYRNFEDIYEKHRLNEKPVFYLTSPSVTDETVAPEGHEILNLMIPVSNQLALTKRKQEAMVNGAIKRIEAAIGQKFKNDITIKHVFGPEYFAKRFHAYKGSAFGLSQTLLQSGPLRPRLQSKKVHNLYFVGQDTNPGTGVPLVILSGKLVSRVINSA